MVVIGTCGHELRGIDDNVLLVKEYEGQERVIAQICVCDKCAKWWKEKGYVLETREAKRKWLREDK